jgi:hypothetical protein
MTAAVNVTGLILNSIMPLINHLLTLMCLARARAKSFCMTSMQCEHYLNVTSIMSNASDSDSRDFSTN